MPWHVKLCMYLLWLYFVLSIAVGVFFWLWLLYIVIQSLTTTGWLVACGGVAMVAFIMFGFAAWDAWKTRSGR